MGKGADLHGDADLTRRNSVRITWDFIREDRSVANEDPRIALELRAVGETGKISIFPG